MGKFSQNTPRVGLYAVAFKHKRLQNPVRPEFANVTFFLPAIARVRKEPDSRATLREV